MSTDENSYYKFKSGKYKNLLACDIIKKDPKYVMKFTDRLIEQNLLTEKKDDPKDLEQLIFDYLTNDTLKILNKYKPNKEK